MSILKLFFLKKKTYMCFVFIYSFSKIKTSFYYDSTTCIELEFPLGLLLGSKLHTEWKVFTALSGEASFPAFLLLLSTITRVKEDSKVV